MKRPDNSSLEMIEAILKDIEETENALQSLRDRLDETVQNLGQDIPDREKLIELATYLYWMVPEIRSEPLALAVTGEPKVHLLKKHISAVTTGITCDRCNAPIPFESRSKLQTAIRGLKRGGIRWAEGYQMVCKNCEVEIFAERKVHYVQTEKAQNKRLQELRQMPYREYLQTPEWQARRQRHLKSAKFRCQVCNTSGKQLNVHHRTYERRGDELYQDLIVLCKDCHEIFHRQGKLSYE